MCAKSRAPTLPIWKKTTHFSLAATPSNYLQIFKTHYLQSLEKDRKRRGWGWWAKVLIVDQRPWFISGWLFWATRSLKAEWMSWQLFGNPGALEKGSLCSAPPPATRPLPISFDMPCWARGGDGGAVGERSLEFSRTEVVKYCPLSFLPSPLGWLTFW